MSSAFYEGVIIENPTLAADWREKLAFPSQGISEPILKPAGTVKNVPYEVYREYRRGRDSACVDIVIVTRLPNGTPAVLLSLRKPNACFGGKWWIYGGALEAYASIEDFISERATKECGVPVRPEALIGVYRTMTDDALASTLQPCYAAFVPFDVMQKKMTIDDDHGRIKLFTLPLLPKPGDEGWHWYTDRVARRALLNLPSESEYSRYSPPDRDVLNSDPTN